MNKIIINKKNLPKEIGWLSLQIHKREGIRIKDMFEVVKHKGYSKTALQKLPGDVPFIGGGIKSAGYTCADEVLFDVFTISKKGSAGAVNYFKEVVMMNGSALTLKLKEEYNYLDKEVLALIINQQAKLLKELGAERCMIPGLTQTHILDYKIQIPTEQEIKAIDILLKEKEELNKRIKEIDKQLIG